MNVDQPSSSSAGPQVPVTTLAGTVSLSELLPELPLPGALPNDRSRSLLFHPRVAEEAQRHIAAHDETLAEQLAQALISTSAEHIEIKSHIPSSKRVFDPKSGPPLLKAILKANPVAFTVNDVKKEISSPAQPQKQNEFPTPKNIESASSSRSTNRRKSVLPVANHMDARSLNSPAGLPMGSEAVVRVQKLDISQTGQFQTVIRNSGSLQLSNSLTPKLNHIGTPKNEGLKKPVLKLEKLTDLELKNYPNVRPTESPAAARRNRFGRHGKGRFQDGSESESDEEQKKTVKYFKSREREREKGREKQRKEKRRRDSDDDYDPTSKKNKSDDLDNIDSDQDVKYEKTKQPTPKKLHYNRKRLERKLDSKTSGEKLTDEELMETGVYQRFTRAVEKIFDSTEDIDLNADIDNDDDVPQEYLIPKYDLRELCSETAKLKSIGAMSLVPPERLVRLLNILEKNIRDGSKVTPVVDDEDGEEEKLWLELVMERIMRGVDASLTVLYILTSKNMSKRVYLEDVIDRCVKYSKFQLNNTIFPSFDPVYRINGKDIYLGGMKRKRAHVRDVRDRNILNLYNKLHEIVSLIAELLSLQTLTDTTVLLLSTLGVAPFFVENVPELQLAALKLVTMVFSKYEKHRRLLLEDILASIARLPSSKRSLRTYRLNSDENIQMLTALVLQLIQCIVDLPQSIMPNKPNKKGGGSDNKEVLNVDRDVLVNHQYETAMKTAYSFFSVFLEKTGSKNEEIDYRPLFENFVQDLLVTVNKPEWPSAELLLSFLGKLLVTKFSNKNTEMTLRVSSLDCLGIVAARLRKDAVTSRLKVATIDSIIREIKEEQDRDAPVLEDGAPAPAPLVNGDVEETPTKKSKKKKGGKRDQSPPKDLPKNAGVELEFDEEGERTNFLQQVLLDWLAVNSESDASLLHSRHFYIGQWYRDAYSDIMSQKLGPRTPKKIHKSHKKKRKKKKGEESEEESSEASESEPEVEDEIDENFKAQISKLAEKRKLKLLSKITPFPPASPGARIQTLQTHIDYEHAELITRYLASKRSFSQSFDSYLKQILSVLSESAIAVRTKAMKCLTMIVDADSSVLGRTDMQLCVSNSFLDHSTSVREAAVDLVGKFVLLRPELISKYYDAISARILDTGVSVRKRVIKILKDICLEFPDFKKIPEICVKMIRRVNDEEGIKKLVQEVFQNMWFTPVRERPKFDIEALKIKVNNITEVIMVSQDASLDYIEQLLYNLFRPKEDKEDVTKIVTEPPKMLVTACKQIVDCLVTNILRLEENEGSALPENGEKELHTLSEDGKSGELAQKQEIVPINNQKQVSLRLVACLQTLHLFSKVRPSLVVDHALTLQPYLSLKCQDHLDFIVISTVARTLELIVPLIEHPSEIFLSQLEEDAVKLVLLCDKTVIKSCVALLGSIVNTVTRNYRLIKDCFNRYFNFIVDYKTLHEQCPNDIKLITNKPHFRRALFTVGLLVKHFDFSKSEVRAGLPHNIGETIVDTLLYFVNFTEESVKYGAVQSIGSVCIRHYKLMTTKRVKELYHNLLLDPDVSPQLKGQVLLNIESYLQEDEIRMIQEDKEWAKTRNKESIKEMCDVQSGMASTIIQIYLQQIMECVIHRDKTTRHTALKVIQLVLAQGLVHPVQIVPFLICMSTDYEESISLAADKQIQDIEKKYPGFINMKAMQGFRHSYRLQYLIQPVLPVRGMRIRNKGEQPSALNGFLYSIMRTTKNQRRAVAMSLLKQFDEHAKVPLSYQLYVADNLAYFPYQVLDEPLFIIHHIDIIISVAGSSLLQFFKESLLPPPNVETKLDPVTGQVVYHDDDDDVFEEPQDIVKRLPDDVSPLVECMTASQGCGLLLLLKTHLKEVFGITENKIWHYSPSDTTKQFEKSASRKSHAKFNPKSTLTKMSQQTNGQPVADPHEDAAIPQLNQAEVEELAREYLAFKELMLKIDREEEIDSDDERVNTRTSNDFNHVNNRSFTSRSQRLQQQAKKTNELLLPGTRDDWANKLDNDKIGNCEVEKISSAPQQNSIGEPHPTNETPPPQDRIKPLKIRTSQISLPTDRHKHRHKSSHKKHKKKKKRRKIIDSESDNQESSDFSDPDFTVS